MGGEGREKDKQTKEEMYRKIRAEETNQTNVAVKMRVWGRGEEDVDRQRQGRREDSQRPEHAALLVPTK